MTILEFKDHQDTKSKEDCLKKEIEGARHTYRIPGYNVPHPHSHISFRRNPTYCVDIGANVGGFSIYASTFFKQIIGFEAASNTYKVGRENIDKAGFKNLELHHLAAAAKSDEIVYLRSHEGELSRDANCFNPAEHMTWVEGAVEETLSISLDDIYSRYDIDYIDYLKVDCEGSEYPLLMNKDLSKINFLALELHPGFLGEKLTVELLEYLDSYFTIVFQLDEHLFLYESKY
jgi:FkbM family methyltransferase